MSAPVPEELAAYLLTLPHSLREYAYRYAEHISTGDLEPARDGLDPQLAGEIRTRLHAEWRRRKHALRERNQTRRKTA